MGIVHRFFDAFERRDREDVAALLHPQVEWHTVAAPPFGVEAMHGRDEALHFMFEQIEEGIEDFRAVLEEVRELCGDQVLSVAHYEGRGVASGTAARMTAAAIYRVEANQIVFFQDFTSGDEASKPPGRRSRRCLERIVPGGMKWSRRGGDPTAPRRSPALRPLASLRSARRICCYLAAAGLDGESRDPAVLGPLSVHVGGNCLVGAPVVSIGQQTSKH